MFGTTCSRRNCQGIAFGPFKTCSDCLTYRRDESRRARRERRPWYVRAKPGEPRTCPNCGEKGHNKRTCGVVIPNVIPAHERMLMAALGVKRKGWNQPPPVTIGLDIEIRSESLHVDRWEPAIVFYIIGSPQAPHDLDLVSIAAVLESGREVELSLTSDFGTEWRLRSIEVNPEKG